MENPDKQNLSSSTFVPPSEVVTNQHQIPYPQNYPPGYHQPYAPPPAGQPYYPQPGFIYPGPPAPNYNYQPPQSQQQQHMVIVNNQPPGMTTVVALLPPPVSMVGAIVLSCIVFWCFGWLCGGIAFILAMVGQSSAAVGDTRSAIQMRNASYGLSIAGIVTGIIIIAVVAGIYGSAAYYASKRTPNRCYNNNYNYYYNC